MVTFYCPNCWSTIEEQQEICPSCGYHLDEFDRTGFEDKLLAALSHPVPERRIMAAQILGMRNCQRALPEFLKIINSDEASYYFLRAVLMAAAQIDHPGREEILQRAVQHPSHLVSQLARELLTAVHDGSTRAMWDTNTS